MLSVPTTSLDLGSPGLAADPYPLLAAEREQHAVAWHPERGTWLTFDHAATSAVLRNRGLGRIWRDREPAAYLEPFNLLHRNQMMENEPPDHTRLRRLVAGAFARGHVERLRPRVQELAAQLLEEVADGPFDVIGAYAEPLPVLVIAELLGVPTSLAPDLRDWSQAIVRMYEPSPSDTVVAAAVQAADAFAACVRELARERAERPADDLLSDLVAAREGAQRLSEDEVVASAVLLLNAGHEASVNVFGNGLVALLRSPAVDRVRERARDGDVSGVPTLVEEMLRFDSALHLFERTATRDVEVAGQVVREGERIAALLGAANRDPAVFVDADTFDPDRAENPHVAFGAGLHFCLGAPLARMELTESLGLLLTRHPDLDLAGEPEPRGTFVLRGFESVTVEAPAPARRVLG